MVARVKQSAVKAIHAEFDGAFSATAQGGAVLAEKVMRRLTLRRLMNEHLPARSSEVHYSMLEGAYALTAGLLVGGRWMKAAEVLGEVKLLEEMSPAHRAPRAWIDFAVGIPRTVCLRQFQRVTHVPHKGLKDLGRWPSTSFVLN